MNRPLSQQVARLYLFWGSNAIFEHGTKKKQSPFKILPIKQKKKKNSQVFKGALDFWRFSELLVWELVFLFLSITLIDDRGFAAERTIFFFGILSKLNPKTAIYSSFRDLCSQNWTFGQIHTLKLGTQNVSGYFELYNHTQLDFIFRTHYQSSLYNYFYRKCATFKILLYFHVHIFSIWEIWQYF